MCKTETGWISLCDAAASQQFLKDVRRPTLVTRPEPNSVLSGRSDRNLVQLEESSDPFSLSPIPVHPDHPQKPDIYKGARPRTHCPGLPKRVILRYHPVYYFYLSIFSWHPIETPFLVLYNIH